MINRMKIIYNSKIIDNKNKNIWMILNDLKNKTYRVKNLKNKKQFVLLQKNNNQIKSISLIYKIKAITFKMKFNSNIFKKMIYNKIFILKMTKFNNPKYSIFNLVIPNNYYNTTVIRMKIIKEELQVQMHKDRKEVYPIPSLFNMQIKKLLKTENLKKKLNNLLLNMSKQIFHKRIH